MYYYSTLTTASYSLCYSSVQVLHHFTTAQSYWKYMQTAQLNAKILVPGSKDTWITYLCLSGYISNVMTINMCNICSKEEMMCALIYSTYIEHTFEINSQISIKIYH